MRSLLFWVTSCLLVGAALVSCNRSGGAGVEIDSRLKGYLLPKSKVLAGVDLDKIKQTDFFKRHQSQLDFPQLNQLPAEIGMDPRRDLSSFLMAWDGSDALIMTRGTYSPDQLEKRLGGATQSEKFNKLTLYGDGKRDVVFLQKGIALVGSAVVLKRTLNDGTSGSAAMTEDMQAQLARINKGAQVWEASSGVIPLDQLGLRSDASSALANIAGFVNGTAVGITISGGVGLDARISCISEEGSQRVHDALRGVIGLARLNTRDDQMEQLKIWDSIKVEKQAKEVHVTADFPADVADKALALLPSYAKKM